MCTKLIKLVMILGLSVFTGNLWADNPLVTDIYTADPTARVFDGKLYIYPSHDIREHDGLTGDNGYMMEDYHVFSTTDLMNYTDHGVILDQKDVSWVDNNSYAMWAPDCIEKGGKYYFYFPGNFKIGVAISDNPTGPFIPEPRSIEEIGTKSMIDPNCFIDDNGTPYLYYGAEENMRVVRLKDDMKTPDSDTLYIQGLPTGYKEGAFMFKRNGIYYYTFPHDPTGKGEEIAYATGTSPLGPFEYQGVIMDRWIDNCWTNHHSIVEYKGQWYIFYHHHELTGDMTLRSMHADRLYFNEDGSIPKVIPTRRGVGVRVANEQIQVDRFNTSSGLSTPRYNTKEQPGFYVSNIQNNSWLTYSDVDFKENTYTSVVARVSSRLEGGVIEIRLGSTSGDLIGSIDVPNTGSLDEWRTVMGEVTGVPQGLQNIALTFKGAEGTADIFRVNWIRFNEANTFHLGFAGNGAGMVKLNDSYSIKKTGKEVLLNVARASGYVYEATAEPGSKFIGWRYNGETVASVPTDIKQGDVVTAIFKSILVPVIASERIEAEEYTFQNGIQSENCPEGGSNIGYIENDDYIVFENVDFGTSGLSRLSVRASSIAAGGKVEVRIDGANSDLLGTVSISNTGDWTSYKTFTGNISSVTGVHDVYWKFTGSGGYLFNINWFEFTGNQ